MPIRYAGNDNRITYGKTPIKSIMQGETAVYGEDVFAKQPLFTYSEAQNSVTITGLTDLGKTRENIIVPSEYNGKAVTSLSSTAFNNATNLKSVIVPNSVTAIGEGCFSGCGALESITVPFVGGSAEKTSSDTYQYPFGYIFGTSSYEGGTAVKQRYYGSSTSSTTSITYYIPSSLRSVTVTGGNILGGAFDNCSMLTSITIPDNVTSIGSLAFYNCTGLTTVTIPDSVTSIGDHAFADCDGLTSVTIPDSVTSIDESAFYNCNSLTTVTIGDGVTSIGDHAFSICVDLTSVTIGDGVTRIGDWAFEGCTGLTSVTFTGTIAQWNAITKGSGWNLNCPFTEVVCSDGTVSV